MNRTKVAEYLSLIEKFQNTAESSDTWFDVSVKLFTEYWECEGDHNLNWKGRGYKTIFDILLVKDHQNYLMILN